MNKKTMREVKIMNHCFDELS